MRIPTRDDDGLGGMPDEDRLPEALHEVARAYHEPPSAPREAMWGAIAAARAKRRAAHAWRRRALWALPLAAMLVLGIGLGRMLGPRRAEGGKRFPVAALAPTPYRVAAGQYLTRAEVLLTEYRAESRRGRLPPAFVASARDLLTTTRLMLDSPAGDDPHLAALLQDLELVLAQISQLQDAPDRRDELDLIDQSITRSSMLPRLRAATPGAGGALRAQGAL